MSLFFEVAIALLALTAMEIVLGIDNIVFIALLTGRLPPEQQAKARTIGLGLAMGLRVLLLLTLSWVLGLTKPVFELSQLGFFVGWLRDEHHAALNEVSWRDLILLAGGLFLIYKSVVEIHERLEGPSKEERASKYADFVGVITQILILDLVFSLDSVITAVGMVRAELMWVMVVAIIIAVIVMLVFAGQVSRFVERHPTLKMLALSFLLLIGVMLMVEGVGTHFDKGYIYFAMAFALGVECLNLAASRHKHGKGEHGKGEHAA